MTKEFLYCSNVLRSSESRRSGTCSEMMHCPFLANVLFNPPVNGAGVDMTANAAGKIVVVRAALSFDLFKRSSVTKSSVVFVCDHLFQSPEVYRCLEPGGGESQFLFYAGPWSPRGGSLSFQRGCPLQTRSTQCVRKRGREQRVEHGLVANRMPGQWASTLVQMSTDRTSGTTTALLAILSCPVSAPSEVGD
jgi:hypothetical protein